MPAWCCPAVTSTRKCWPAFLTKKEDDLYARRSACASHHRNIRRRNSPGNRVCRVALRGAGRLSLVSQTKQARRGNDFSERSFGGRCRTDSAQQSEPTISVEDLAGDKRSQIGNYDCGEILPH